MFGFELPKTDIWYQTNLTFFPVRRPCPPKKRKDCRSSPCLPLPRYPQLKPKQTYIIVVLHPANQPTSLPAAFNTTSHMLGARHATGHAVTPSRVGWASLITMPSHSWPDSSDTTHTSHGCPWQSRLVRPRPCRLAPSPRHYGHSRALLDVEMWLVDFPLWSRLLK
jgi:hypothetical protein